MKRLEYFNLFLQCKHVLCKNFVSKIFPFHDWESYKVYQISQDLPLLFIIISHVLFFTTSHVLFFITSHVLFIITSHVLFFAIRGRPYTYSMNNYRRTQISLPLAVYVEGIARTFNWLKCLGGIMHLKPTAGCQISTLIFGLWGLYCHLGFKSKVLPGPLPHLSALVN